MLLPLLRSRLGIEAQVELVRRGFYPKGGGILDLTVRAAAAEAWDVCSATARWQQEVECCRWEIHARQWFGACPRQYPLANLLPMAALQVQALPSGSPLPPLDLTDRGSLTSIDIRTFAAGRVAPGTEQRLAAAAAQDLRRGLVHDLRVEGVVLQQLAVRETPDSAFGNGAGMLLVAHTSTGCR